MSDGVTASFHGKLVLWQTEKTAWHFITLPLKLAEEIRFFHPTTRGWKSLRCDITIGATTWQTSIFPDKKSGSFILPVKVAVRQSEGLAAGDEPQISLKVLA